MVEPTNQQAQERKRVLAFIMQAGQLLLENGAEVFRVEQTMIHMAHSYQITPFHVFVITNGIFVSAGEAEYSELRNVASRGVHLGRVAALNALSRQIAAEQLPIAQAEQALEEVRAIPNPSYKARVLASAFGAFSFCFLFGGSALDAVVSLCAGGALGLYLFWCQTRRVEHLFQCVSGAALVSAFCMVISQLFSAAGIHTSAAIIGAFMILTPGVAFTMSIRDFVRSDYLSGTIRMIDAVLVAASIAIGAGLVLLLEQIYLGGVA